MIWLLFFLKYFLCAFVTWRLVSGLYLNRKDIGFIWQIWRRFRPVMLLEVLVLLTTTLVSFVAIYRHVPFLRWGWFNLVAKEGGNAAFAPIILALYSHHLFVRLIVPLFLSLLIVNIPFLARREEYMFRQGYYKWLDVAEHSIRFALVHFIMGIPVAAVLAIIPSGFFLGIKYRNAYLRLRGDRPAAQAEEDAAIVTTTYHAMYNTIAVGVVLLISLRVAFP